MNTKIDKDEYERYSRQIKFHGLTEAGQNKLKNSRVMILGCGGLGATSATLLTRAGIGYIKLVDRDIIEFNNLQRQLLYDENDVKEGLPKAIAAERKLKNINSAVKIESVVADVNRMNIEKLIGDVHLVVDACDNLETRFLLNEACIKHKIPWIYGAAVESYGLTMNIIPGKTSCLKCIMDTIPKPGSVPTCETIGVLGPIVNIIASIQSAEAIKFLSGNKRELNQKLINIDIWQNSFESIDVTKSKIQKNCSVCNQKHFDFLTGKQGISFTTLCGRNAVQLNPFEKTILDLNKLAGDLSKFGKVTYNEFLIQFEIEKYNLLIFLDGRAVIRGIKDTGIARSLYSRYIGN